MFFAWGPIPGSMEIDPKSWRYVSTICLAIFWGYIPVTIAQKHRPKTYGSCTSNKRKFLSHGPLTGWPMAHTSHRYMSCCFKGTHLQFNIPWLSQDFPSLLIIEYPKNLLSQLIFPIAILPYSYTCSQNVPSTFHISLKTCISVCMYVCIYIYTRIFVHIYVCTHVCIYPTEYLVVVTYVIFAE